MKKCLLALALTAAIVPAIADGKSRPRARITSAVHAGCSQPNPPGNIERCSAYGSFTHFQLTGTGKFWIQLPGNPTQVVAHYVSYQNWQAYLVISGATPGWPTAGNIGCCTETYSNGWVW